MPAPVVAVDVGGTSIKGARLAGPGEVLAAATLPTPVADGPAAVVAAIRAVVAQLLDPSVAAIGVVVPGSVDVRTGTAVYAANLGWTDVPLGALLRADTDRPVAIEHDVRAAGLAERVLGAARDAADCLVVVIGTGIAGVATAAGQSVRGARDLAGEIGHVSVYPDGEWCRCGGRGCTEVYASAAGIARRYAAATGRASTAADVAAARASDPAAREVWDAATMALGIALANCTMVLDPSLVVLGGGLAAAGPALRDPVAATLAARLPWRPAPALEISPLGGRAGLLGAGLLAQELAGGR